MAMLDKWQTILLTSWKWQLLVGTSLGGLILLIIGVWLLRRRRRNRIMDDAPDLMFAAPDDFADQPTVSFRDDWADPYAPAPVVEAVEPVAEDMREPEASPVPAVTEPVAAVEPVAANDTWLMPAEAADPPPAPIVSQAPDAVEQRVAKLEAAVVALTDLLRPARTAAGGGDLTDRLDALEKTLTARFDALARVLNSLPTGSPLSGFGADPEAVASAVVEIRRTLRG